jgi:hypothetical protein
MRRLIHLPHRPHLARLARLVAAAALLFAAAYPAPAGADLLVAIHGHADTVKLGNRTQPPRDSNARIWLASDKMRRDEGSMSVIVRLDRHMLYLLNHADRTYSQVEVPIDWKKMVPPADQDSFAKFLADNEIVATVTPSANTRKIQAWSTHRVDVVLTNKHGLRMANQMWLTKDLPLYAAYNKMSGVLASLQPNAAAWSQKVALLDGFPVYQETTITIGKSVSQTREELVSSETKEAPPGTYDIPAGFTAVPYDPFHASQ